MKSTSFIVNILLILVCLTLVDITPAQVILKNCSRDNLLNCPKYSLCTQTNNNDNEALKCICIENFQLNPNWLEYENLNSSMLLDEHYCITSDKGTSVTPENKLIVYIRSPARKVHLAFGILMVLLAATLATVILYGFKVLNPIKRTKSIYQKIKYKRRNITPLHETDELEMNRRYEMQTL